MKGEEIFNEGIAFQKWPRPMRGDPRDRVILKEMQQGGAHQHIAQTDRCRNPAVEEFRKSCFDNQYLRHDSRKILKA